MGRSCKKCGAPVIYMEDHPIGLSPFYDASKTQRLKAENKELKEKMKKFLNKGD